MNSQSNQSQPKFKVTITIQSPAGKDTTRREVYITNDADASVAVARATDWVRSHRASLGPKQHTRLHLFSAAGNPVADYVVQDRTTDPQRRSAYDPDAGHVVMQPAAKVPAATAPLKPKCGCKGGAR